MTWKWFHHPVMGSLRQNHTCTSLAVLTLALPDCTCLASIPAAPWDNTPWQTEATTGPIMLVGKHSLTKGYRFVSSGRELTFNPGDLPSNLQTGEQENFFSLSPNNSLHISTPRSVLYRYHKSPVHKTKMTPLIAMGLTILARQIVFLKGSL